MATVYTLSMYADYTLTCNTSKSHADLCASFWHTFSSDIYYELDDREIYEGTEALSMGAYNCDQIDEILTMCDIWIFDGIEWLEGAHEV